MPRQPFEELPVGHAWLGADLDYYETIYKLGRDVFEPYFRGLRDVVFDDEIRADVEDSEADRVSLLRFGGAKRTTSRSSSDQVRAGDKFENGEGSRPHGAAVDPRQR
jgi:hypothetical protein